LKWQHGLASLMAGFLPGVIGFYQLNKSMTKSIFLLRSMQAKTHDTPKLRQLHIPANIRVNKSDKT
jgi:hypothetical protein